MDTFHKSTSTARAIQDQKNDPRDKTRKSCCYDEKQLIAVCHDHGMDKSTSATIRATCRDQFEPEHCRAQKAGNSALGTMDLTLAIDLPGLAAAIGANSRSLRNAFYAHPQDFPPAIYLPGTRGPRFLVSDVQAWLESRKVKPSPASPPPVAPKPQGRPRKASQAEITLARQGKGGAA
jgi:predicted DNA-binding transcriptional regulator AlpA